MNAQLVAQALVLHESDSVAIALVPLAAGQCLSVQIGTKEWTVQIVDDIPRYHKVALIDLPSKRDVKKGGDVIGRTTVPVRAGAHIHTHNLTGTTCIKGKWRAASA